MGFGCDGDDGVERKQTVMGKVQQENKREFRRSDIPGAATRWKTRREKDVVVGVDGRGRRK